MKTFLVDAIIGEPPWENNHIWDFIIGCTAEDVFCTREKIVKSIQYGVTGADSQTCMVLDMLLGGAMDQASTEGIRNGITLILFTGGSVLANIFNGSHPKALPGMYNPYTPFSGSSGLKVGIQEAGIFNNPYLMGDDVPSGVSATIGITASKTIHLPHPYTNCSTVDKEVQLLYEEIKRDLGNATPAVGHNTIQGVYKPINCRLVISNIIISSRKILQTNIHI